jgi:zinc finger protein 830
MSDVRSLLKAKRQEIRIDHPLASYTSSGQLRCIVCETTIKHPSAWDGHLGSKAHRTNATRIREEERKRKELELEEEAKRLKRKVPEDDLNEDLESTAKKSRVTSVPRSSTSNLPLDFFSDPSRAPLPSFNDPDGEGETGETAALTKPTDGGGDSSLDQEWVQFQQSVINAPDSAATYDRATIFAEPELVSDPTEGFPTHDDHGAHASPVTRVDEDERRRKDQEERELIMDRLMDEERAQEEADMKVTIMKNKLAALRKRREASRTTKSNVEVV